MPRGLTLDPARLREAEPTAIERAARHDDLGAVPVAAAAIGERVALACGDGRLWLFGPDGATAAEAHRGAILSLAVEGAGGLVTGGDDGRLVRTDLFGRTEEVASFGRWVDHVAVGAGGRIAGSTGRSVHVLEPDGRRHELGHPSSAGGLAFDRRGGRLAVAHYGGVTVWSRERRGWKPSKLVWAGSHTGVSWSPDDRFLITRMQENALHGWRMRDRADLSMSGYPAKVRGWAWVGARPFLATTGAEQAILWPFDGANGPMGRASLQLCWSAPALVTAIAAAPGREAVFAGFATGEVVFSEATAGAEPRLVKRRPGAAIAALACTAAGRLLIADEEGRTLWADLGAP